MEPVIIDGSVLEGGGQMLRTALGLSAFTNKPFKITNIRKGREVSGLKEQHLQAVNAVALLCNAEVRGAFVKSSEIKFSPQRADNNDISVKIATAGSVGLVLQALLIAAIDKTLRIKIEGGATFGKWAAPTEHLRLVLFPLLHKLGFDAKIKVEREGFYPKGGAIVEVNTDKANLKKIELLDKGILKSIKVISVASASLMKAKVAERQAEAAVKILNDNLGLKPEVELKYSPSICPGSAVQIAVETENSIIGGNALGEIGKKAESVGEEAARDAINEFENGAVDCRTADQLLPFFALAKGGSLRTSRITNHIRANIFVIEKFLPVKFFVDENKKRVSLG